MSSLKIEWCNCKHSSFHPSVFYLPICLVLTTHSPLALLPPGKAPAIGWAQPSALKAEVVFFGAGAGAGTLPGCGGRTDARVGGTESNEDTGGTGTAAAAAAQIPRLAEPTGKQGKEDQPPQTQAGTASWPACVLQRLGEGYGG